MPKSPTVTVTLDKPRTVVFDLACIQRVEESTQLGCFELAEKWSSLFEGFPIPTRENPDATPSDEQARSVAKRIRVGFGMQFIAGCLGVSHKEAEGIIGTAQFLPTLFALVPGFIVAMNALGTGKDQDEEGGAEGKAGGAGAESQPTG